MAWRNPLDVMRKHKIKRSSSDAGTHTRSPLTSSLVRQGSEGSDVSAGKSPATPTLGLGLSASRSSQKRRNPFIRDPSRSPKKRKSLVKQSPQKLSAAVTATVEEECSVAESADLSSGREKLNLLSSLDSLEAHSEQPSVKEAEESTAKNFNKPMAPLLVQPEEPLKTRPLKELKAVLEESKPVKAQHRSPPVDWSIKTKLRLVTPIEVSTNGRRPGSEARHLHAHVHQSLDTDPEWSEMDVSERVRRCCFHYSHPHLPWTQAFPRTAQHYRTRVPSVAAFNEDILKALHKDWCSAFTSVYQQLRCGLCPYFYLCTAHFTVVFRCRRSRDTQGSQVTSSWSALLSPSTRGLRELLTKEGIPFSLPNSTTDQPSASCVVDSSEGKENKPGGDSLPDRRRSHSVNDVLSEIKDNDESERDGEIDGKCKYGEGINKQKEEEDSDSDDESLIHLNDGASQWLQSLGMNRRDFPELEPDKVKIQLEGFREIDNRPTSMVYVEGPNIHPFFDFLLNFQNCTAPSGDQMGLPPTILAPGPFLGGTLVQNSVKVSTLKDTAAGSLPVKVYEIAGPILPHHTLNIASIVKAQYDRRPSVPMASLKSGVDVQSAKSGHSVGSTQPSVLSYSTHAPSAAFNTHKVNDPMKDKMAEAWEKMTVDPSQASAGLLTSVSSLLTTSPSLTSGQFVRDLEVGDTGFSWH